MDLIELPDILPLVNIINDLNWDNLHSTEDFSLLVFKNGRFAHPSTTESIRSRYTLEAKDDEEMSAKKALEDLFHAVEKINKVVCTQHLSLRDLIYFDDTGKPCKALDFFWQRNKNSIHQRRQQKR